MTRSRQPETVLRAKEIHRQHRIPKVSEALDLRAVLAGVKSRRTFEKMRNGLDRRLRR